MQIIVIPSRLAKARCLTLSTRHLALAFAAGMGAVFAAAVGLYWMTLRLAPDSGIPVLNTLVGGVRQIEGERARQFVQQNLNAMAVKIGEMQAQLTRLDALGERLSSMAGLKPQDFRFTQVPGLGGPAPVPFTQVPGLGGPAPVQSKQVPGLGGHATVLPTQNLTLTEFQDRLASLSRGVELRADMLGVLDAQLFEQTVQKKLLPTMMPVNAPFNASGFGYRIDPFTGQQALHEGIDFMADLGTPVLSAAGGIVLFAGMHPQYGNMIDIDHGNDLTTRYAHLSKILVKEGDLVPRGRRIGETGSTGRSTGPHLHFEVRFRGAAQNPMRFLEAGQPGAAQVATAARNAPARNAPPRSTPPAALNTTP